MAAQGIEAEARLVGLDRRDDIEYRVTAALRAGRRDCVVVGGGIRKPEDQFELFESIVNLVHDHAPSAAIAFSSTPQDVVDAVTRRLHQRE